jgi:hypothetical protein
MGIATYFYRIQTTDLEQFIKDEDYASKYLRGISFSEMEYYDRIKDGETIGKLLDEHELYLENNPDYFVTGYWVVLNYLVVSKDENLRNDTSSILYYIAYGKHVTEMPNITAPGYVKYFTPDEVVEISNLITKIDLTSLIRRYDYKEFNHKRLYFKRDTWTQNDAGDILIGIKQIFDFYHQTALRKVALLVYH